MIKVGMSIKTPKDNKFYKVFFNEKNNSSTLSILYNELDDNKKVVGRYCIQFVGLGEEVDKMVKIEEILSVNQKISTAKNGKEYVNTYVWCRGSLQNPRGRLPNELKSETPPNQEYNQQSYSEAQNSLSDYADYI